MRKVPFESIPVIDLGPWFAGDARGKRDLTSEINAICRDVGFMYVKNHRIPQRSIDDAFQAARRFFALADEEKLQVHYEKSGYHRGFVPINAESSDPAAKGDIKEAFDCGLEVSPHDLKSPAARRMQSPNLWPANLPVFRETVEQYFDVVMNLARTLFQIFAVGFNLPEDFFNGKISNPIAQLRLLHYPPQNPPSTTDQLGIGAHTDYECFTILAQDQVGGLQVQNQVGDWIEAPPISGAFVVNIGEMMARWTNDLFAATWHRVINTSGLERYSIPFFFATNYETIITCLETCTDPHRPARYPAIAAGDYLAQRLKEIYGN